MGWMNVTAHGGLKPPKDPSGAANGTALVPGKGRTVPVANLVLNAGAGVFMAEIAIPDGVIAVRLFADAQFYAVADITTADPAVANPPLPYDCVFDMHVLGCTWLHLAQVGGNAVISYAWVHNGQGV